MARIKDNAVSLRYSIVVMKVVKILIVNTVPTERNGITNVILNFYRAMDKSDLVMDLVSINPVSQEYSDLFENNGGHVYYLERKLGHPFRYIHKLRKLAENYDILHAHGNSATMVLEMFAAWMAGVRIRIAHSHNTSCSHKFLDRCVRPLFYFFCNGRLACGKDAGRWLYGKRDFVVLNNGIDVEKFRYSKEDSDNIRRQYNLMGCKVIGHVGNFVYAKNQQFLVNVFKEVHTQDKTCRLILVGDGVMMNDTVEVVKRLGLEDCVKFVGSVNNPQAYLSAMDLIVMPSIHEGLPLTLLEEQANGLRCIVSDAITSDVNLTGNVRFISLDESTHNWTDVIIGSFKECNEMIEKNRYEQSLTSGDIIKRRGFDVIAEAIKLKEYYKSVNK